MEQQIIFDTYRYVKQLVEAGMPEAQAEVIANQQKELIEGKLASQQQLANVEANLKRDIKELETRLKHDIKELDMRITNVEANLKRDIKELENNLKKDIIIKLGMMMIGCTAFLTAALPIIIRFIK